MNIESNPNLSIIELPKKIPGTDHYDSYENVTAKFAGFGHDYLRMEDDGMESGNSTGLLHRVNITIIDNAVCNAKFNDPITDAHFCTLITPRNLEMPTGPCIVSFSYSSISIYLYLRLKVTK